MARILPSELSDLDVLCGKDKKCLQAKGSRRFRDIIDQYMPRYIKLETKYSKMSITREIYEVVSQESRFLKFNAAEGVWEEISSNAARDKIGHSLRFSSRAKRRHQKKNKKTHKRSGSFSSTSSSESDSSSSNSTLGNTLDRLLLQSANALRQEPEQPIVSTVEPTFSSNGLDDFLDLELRYENGTTTNVYKSLDDLELLIEQAKLEQPSDDPLDNFMDDIMNVVKAIEAESQQTQHTEEEDSLLTLLSDPVGDWEEDCSVELDL